MLSRMQKSESIRALLMECRMVWHLWKTVWQFLKKINMQQPYDPAIAHWSQINKDMCHTKTFAQRSKAALFVAPNAQMHLHGKVVKQAACVYYNGVYYSAIKKEYNVDTYNTPADSPGNFTGWNKILLGEISQSHELRFCKYIYI